MELTIRPDGILQIDDARITYRQFAGLGDDYTPKGIRNFTLVIEDEAIAETLIAEGWNVRYKEPYREGDNPRWHLKVFVKFNDFGPHAYLITGNRRHKLNEESIHRLDKVRISRVDMDIRPYDWTMSNGRNGRKAMLQSIKVIQRIDDRFADEYEEYETDD